MSILSTILEAKALWVDERKRQCPIAKLPPRDDEIRNFYAALAAPIKNNQRVQAIAEIKRASPSAGPIRPGANPADMASQYEANSAAAISVLTCHQFFDGHLEFLASARAATTQAPLLRKDFIIDPYQIAEAYSAGADAILLIVCALEKAQLKALHACAAEFGLGVLTEIHNQDEAETALAAGARVIGVNHRNLATFEIDLGLTERLAPNVPDGVLLIAESGIRSGADVDRLATAGAHGILVGESLMRAPNPGKALADLIWRQ